MDTWYSRVARAAALVVALASDAANARQIVGDTDLGNGLQLFLMDVQFGAEPVLVHNISDPVPAPFTGAEYVGAAVDEEKRLVYALFYGFQKPSQIVFVSVSVDTGLVVDTSRPLQGEIKLFDGQSPILTIDEAMGGQIVMSFRHHDLAILEVYVIDPASWTVTNAGRYDDPRLNFFLVDGEWSYADDTHQLVVSAGLLNTTHEAYAGVLILASLTTTHDGVVAVGDRRSGTGAAGNVTAHFTAQTFVSELSIMESLGCFSGTSSAREVDGGRASARASSRRSSSVRGAAKTPPSPTPTTTTHGEALARLGLDGSVLGFNTTIAPEVGTVLARWDFSNLDTLENVGEWAAINSTTMWAGERVLLRVCVRVACRVCL
jgi:hypothetical protein